MANKLIQLKDGSDNLYPVMKTREVSFSTGGVPSTVVVSSDSHLLVNGNIVFLILNIDCRNVSGSSVTLAGFVPSGYRPAVRIPGSIGDGGAGTITTVGVSTDGGVTFYLGPNKYAQGVVTYPLIS